MITNPIFCIPKSSLFFKLISSFPTRSMLLTGKKKKNIYKSNDLSVNDRSIKQL